MIPISIFWTLGIAALALSTSSDGAAYGELSYGWVITLISFPSSLLIKFVAILVFPHFFPYGWPPYMNYGLYIVLLFIGHFQWKYLGPYLKSRWDEHKV